MKKGGVFALIWFCFDRSLWMHWARRKLHLNKPSRMIKRIQIWMTLNLEWEQLCGKLKRSHYGNESWFCVFDLVARRRSNWTNLTPIHAWSFLGRSYSAYTHPSLRPTKIQSTCHTDSCPRLIDASLVQKLFLAKVIINTPHVFQHYAQFWIRPLIQLAVRGKEYGQPINYFVQVKELGCG
jgi:hypothetical protein